MSKSGMEKRSNCKSDPPPILRRRIQDILHWKSETWKLIEFIMIRGYFRFFQIFPN